MSLEFEYVNNPKSRFGLFSRKGKYNTKAPPMKKMNLITIPGSVFNEVYMGAPADKPGTGSTIRSNTSCFELFDFKSKFNEQQFLLSCSGKDVLIVSHNKKLQSLIGDMFSQFKQPKKSYCKYGIANCAVLEIFKDNVNYHLKVLFDGFSDKDDCLILQNKEPKQIGGADAYHYLSTSDNNRFKERIDNVKKSLFANILGVANRILLVRHGNGPHNKPYGIKRIFNPPLTALGVYQADLAGNAMKKTGTINFDNLAVFTSQLKRAQQTTLQFLVSAFYGTTNNTNDLIDTNVAILSLDQFIKLCSECLTRFNADTRTLSRKYNFDIQTLLDKSKFFQNNDKQQFLTFVKENNLIDEKQMPQSFSRKMSSNNTISTNSGYDSQANNKTPGMNFPFKITNERQLATNIIGSNEELPPDNYYSNINNGNINNGNPMGGKKTRARKATKRKRTVKQAKKTTRKREMRNKMVKKMTRKRMDKRKRLSSIKH